jgi:hypothetical protein
MEIKEFFKCINRICDQGTECPKDCPLKKAKLCPNYGDVTRKFWEGLDDTLIDDIVNYFQNRRGKWIWDGPYYYNCPVCYRHSEEDFPYCPWCGEELNVD